MQMVKELQDSKNHSGMNVLLIMVILRQCFHRELCMKMVRQLYKM